MKPSTCPRQDTGIQKRLYFRDCHLYLKRLSIYRGNKKVKLYFLIIGFGFYIFFIGLSLTHAQQNPSNAVEIIIGGKQYGSIHEYRREQIKNVLINVLEKNDLQAFTEEELFDIIKDVRKQQTADVPTAEANKVTNSPPNSFQLDQQSNEEDVLDANSFQMEETLKDYLNEHKDVNPVIIDPDKVKTIMIKSKTESKDILLD